MYPRSFLCEEAKIKQRQRNNFVRSVRKQYGNPDSHPFYHVAMRRKLWPKAPAKESALGQMSKNVYFIHIIVLRNQTKKFTIEPKSYTAMLLYLFFDSLLSTCQKKWKLKNGPRLPTLPYVTETHG